ncbi:hypothetical protein ACUN0C_17365 [Faunimonas sp. B44]|uniref:hypothetical protein n=1 Tax=Faunimonas sp. B44 TaxID=3461493 RepID=UPI00404456E9
MPDYTSILRRSLAALPDQSPETRQAVYDRARSALARQLSNLDPPLAPEHEEAQRAQLEHSIEEVEADFAAVPGGEPAGDVAYAGRPAPADPAGAPAAAPHVRESTAADAERRRGAPGQAVRPPVGTATVAAAEGTPEADARNAPIASEPAAEAAADGEPEQAAERYPERHSRAPAMIMAVLVALVLIGAGVLAYTQRDTLAALFGSEQPATELAEGPEPEAAPATGGKNSERLINGGAGAAAPAEGEAADAPPAADPAPEGQGEVAQVEPDPAAPPELTPDQPVPMPDDGAPDTTPVPAEPEAEAIPAPAPETAPAPAPGQSIVAQRAIFYEQGEGEQSGQAAQGQTTWEQVDRPDGLPAIRGIMRIPDRDATVTLTISKNTDQGLPASHMVEIAFEGDLSETAIERVPALVLKPNEQARGQPLAGAAVPVTDTLFWIALSDEEEQINRNVALMRDGSWFDMPLLFTDGKRALLTFEKGIAGDRLFETVMRAWD